jgi:phage tail sheath gpL-like
MSGLSENFVESVQAYDQGYKLPETSGLVLPQKLAVLSPIATSKQSGFADYNVPKRINSYAEALEEYGICPATILMRILKPSTGGGFRGPVDVFPIEDADGASAGGGSITPTASAAATSSNTHYVKFNGRKSIEGRFCSFVVTKDDTIADICDTITAAIQGFLHSPVAPTDDTTKVDLVATWKGISANQIKIEIDTNDDDCGITYAVVDIGSAPTAATGDAEIDDALSNFGETWYTKVINVFGTSTFETFETFNGAPNPETGGTGRWINTVMKPFVAYAGTVLDSQTSLKAITENKEEDLTNELCPAANSDAYEFEVAAAWVVELVARQNNNPALSVLDVTLKDIPGPADGDTGDFKDVDIRDDLVKNGVSTSIFNGSRYVIKSAITFRRPDSQPPTMIDFKFDRDICLDMNIKYNYRLLENTYLVGKTLAKDSDVVNSDAPVIKPKDWLSIVLDMARNLVKKAWLADYDYSKDNTSVAISSANPNRIDTIFNYKITGVARVMTATVYKSFNIGE